MLHGAVMSRIWRAVNETAAWLCFEMPRTSVVALCHHC